jgi:hypothetical protein
MLGLTGQLHRSFSYEIDAIADDDIATPEQARVLGGVGLVMELEPHRAANSSKVAKPRLIIVTHPSPSGLTGANHYGAKREVVRYHSLRIEGRVQCLLCHITLQAVCDGRLGGNIRGVLFARNQPQIAWGDTAAACHPGHQRLQ